MVEIKKNKDKWNTKKREEKRRIESACVSESIASPAVLNCSSVLLCRSRSSGAEGKWPSRHI